MTTLVSRIVNGNRCYNYRNDGITSGYWGSRISKKEYNNMILEFEQSDFFRVEKSKYATEEPTVLTRYYIFDKKIN